MKVTDVTAIDAAPDVTAPAPAGHLTPAEHLLIAADGLAAAQRLYEEVVRECYPPGATVAWDRNGRHGGIVTRHGHGARVQVRNRRTGKTAWIDADDIIRALRRSRA